MNSRPHYSKELPSGNFSFSFLGKFLYWECGLAAGLAAFPALILEWARPGRERGRVQERPFQSPFTKLVEKLGGLGKSYYFRFVLYIILAGPACMNRALEKIKFRKSLNKRSLEYCRKI